MKKFLFFAIIIASVSACSASGDSSTGLPQSTVSISKMTWEGVCVENNGTVNTAGECVADGETIVPAEVCGFSGGILNNNECVYANAGTKPCGGRGQCVSDGSSGLGNCIYDNNTSTAGCQFHGAFCPLNPDGTPICTNDPDNCTAKKPNSPRYRHDWQTEHNFMHGNMGGGNGNGNGQGGNGNGNGQGCQR